MVEYKSELFNERESARAFFSLVRTHVICFFFSLFTARESTREEKREEEEEEEEEFLVDDARLCVQYVSLFYDAFI